MIKQFLKIIGDTYKRARGRCHIIKSGFWFVDIPRTSSTSVRVQLGRRFGTVHGKKDVYEERHASPQIFGDHITARRMRDIVGAKHWRNLFTFTIVRNPWGRIYSMYNWRMKVGSIPAEWSFRQYVLALDAAFDKDELEGTFFKFSGHRLGAYDYVVDKEGRCIIDFIVRYEQRQEGLVTVSQRIGCENLGELKVQAAGSLKPSYTDVYDDETRAVIARLYQNDLKYFGYTFGGLR